MSVTARRPLYSGSGFALNNGAGLALGYDVTVESLEQAIYDLLTEVRAVIGGPGSTVFQQLGISQQTLRDVKTVADGTFAVASVASLAFPETVVPEAVATLAMAASTVAGLGLTGEETVEPVASYTTNIYNGTQTVVPVSPPPSGYGGSTPAELWGYGIGSYEGGGWEGRSAEILMANMASYLNALASADGARTVHSPWFALVGPTGGSLGATLPDWYGSSFGTHVNPPAVDWTLSQEGDTVLQFLERQYPAYGWTQNAPNGVASPFVWLENNTLYQTWWRCVVPDEMVEILAGRATLGGGSSTVGVKPYPGPEDVTLGTPVALDTEVSVDGPMDGVLVNITAVPNGSGEYHSGDTVHYYRRMWLTFLDSDGNADDYQYADWKQGVYIPKSMIQPASCVLRCLAGVEGTVTPWLSNL